MAEGDSKPKLIGGFSKQEAWQALCLVVDNW